MKKNEIFNIAHEYQPFAVAIRQSLHQIPELSWQEEKTLSFIEKKIEKICNKTSIPMSLEKKKGGIYLDITIDKNKKRLLFRSDIDALPIFEKTNLPFRSKHIGLMHACGHDSHAAMLLGTLKAIAENRISLAHNLRLVWQRAEETNERKSGGYTLIQEGILKDISACYALHISSVLDSGLFSSTPGIMMCQSGHLYIEVTCKGGHVMRPQLGSNAIDLITDIHLSLRGFEIRYFGPNEPICFIAALSQAGEACNIRPALGRVCYSVRNFLTEKELKKFIKVIQNRLKQIIKCYPDAKLALFKYVNGFPCLINHKENYLWVHSLLEAKKCQIVKAPLSFAGEDFAYYLQRCPGSYWILGAKKDQPIDHHSSFFDIDETVLYKGIGFWLLIASHPNPIFSNKALSNNTNLADQEKIFSETVKI